MAGTTFTEDDLKEINEKIASGVDEVTFNGRKVRYGDLFQIRKLILEELRQKNNTTAKYSVGVYMRGL